MARKRATVMLQIRRILVAPLLAEGKPLDWANHLVSKDLREVRHNLRTNGQVRRALRALLGKPAGHGMHRSPYQS